MGEGVGAARLSPKPAMERSSVAGELEELVEVSCFGVPLSVSGSLGTSLLDERLPAGLLSAQRLLRWASHFVVRQLC